MNLENNIVGAIFLEKSNASITISNLVVDPSFFRRGIAQSLVNHGLNLYSTSDFLVGTGAENIPAIQLYNKFHFQLISEEIVAPNLKIFKFKRSSGDQ